MLKPVTAGKVGRTADSDAVQVLELFDSVDDTLSGLPSQLASVRVEDALRDAELEDVMKALLDAISHARDLSYRIYTRLLARL